MIKLKENKFKVLKRRLVGKVVKIDKTTGSRYYACLMRLNKDETGYRLSRMLLLLVVWLSSLFIVDDANISTFLMMTEINFGLN